MLFRHRELDVRNKQANTGTHCKNQGLRHNADEPLTETKEGENNEYPAEIRIQWLETRRYGGR